jgi:hypothetical protein
VGVSQRHSDSARPHDTTYSRSGMEVHAHAMALLVQLHVFILRLKPGMGQIQSSAALGGRGRLQRTTLTMVAAVGGSAHTQRVSKMQRESVRPRSLYSLGGAKSRATTTGGLSLLLAQHVSASLYHRRKESTGKRRKDFGKANRENSLARG